MNTNYLREQLVENGPYNALEHSLSTGSTNTDLVAAAHKGAAAWTVMLTEHQETGRGRMGRKFGAPAGSQLTLSFLIRPPHSALERIGTMALATGLALVDALRQGPLPGATVIGGKDTHAAEVGLKWPNDLLAGGRKLCGILAEAVDLGENPAVVIGLGLNTSMTVAELPVAHATSLELEGIPYERNELAVRVLLALHKRMTQWEANDPNLMDDYRAVCTSIGKDVRVILPGDEELLGRVLTVSDDGLLHVRDAQGEEHALAVGDVVHLRLQ
ncbi:biotin--[acetyl-CoA-carboxylase] ligase [Corynebacterium sp. 153RC1]|uniref:biotin--[acetyl-CoA-carboxylase] ligase n=1 Tax=unclassified Corynebacterium TaxID=2624378 RepID=UPI00211C4F98|nr:MULTISPECIES: biotin--[acetyl-CoA-carboxylase] ligase [unclassified Corynebacterium]MCQ9370013.1 biotin--[acetyl-CoA-carboxylase] ligase [Corynebacterium sp. 35RC1]MCQ9352144.1 biotin--[acetyl-CoA-carboxylase] ligase [Corynebacterium sp. 209RC1]MCQ9354147.1 biotin--[acetyl-CoA-carboxylase] ligase [Corynebacterium sp. 1222RC1]MCQ9356427.1 biotin--[acetyl-CoA-carboxylase] ligase [Corynebacterium sp. 122RC1]MCQ9358529.1 biotin--[acetyl-CoA-carboxylase] ligase [Corynebacterium sp. 142RC1]